MYALYYANTKDTLNYIAKIRIFSVEKQEQATTRENQPNVA